MRQIGISPLFGIEGDKEGVVHFVMADPFWKGEMTCLIVKSDAVELVPFRSIRLQTQHFGARGDVIKQFAFGRMSQF